MCHCHDEETARTAGTVQYMLVNLWIYHLNHHFHNIARREKLTAITAEISPYDFLVGFALESILVLSRLYRCNSLTIYARLLGLSLISVIGIENFPMSFLNSLKDFSDSLLNGQLSVGVRTHL